MSCATSSLLTQQGYWWLTWNSSSWCSLFLFAKLGSPICGITEVIHIFYNNSIAVYKLSLKGGSFESCDVSASSDGHLPSQGHMSVTHSPGQTWPSSCSAHSFPGTQLCTYCLWLLLVPQWQSWVNTTKTHMVCQTWSIYYLVLQRKHLPTPDLPDKIQTPQHEIRSL